MHKNLKLRALCAFALLPVIAGCSSARSGAEAAVRESLKDPDSAKFGAFDYDEKTKRGCLTVNAKNSMGGYTGEQQAYVERTEKGWDVIGIADVSPESCRKLHIELT